MVSEIFLCISSLLLWKLEQARTGLAVQAECLKLF